MDTEQTLIKPSLREIIYLDTERVESYISQIAGSVMTEQVDHNNNSRSSAHSAGVPKLLSFGRTDVSAVDFTDTKIPKHAILQGLEALLLESNYLRTEIPSSLQKGQVVRLAGCVTYFENWRSLASTADQFGDLDALIVKLALLMVGNKPSDAMKMRGDVSRLEKKARAKGANSVVGDVRLKVKEARDSIMRNIRSIGGAWSILSEGYLNDIGGLIRLVYQDQIRVHYTKARHHLIGFVSPENTKDSMSLRLLRMKQHLVLWMMVV